MIYLEYIWLDSNDEFRSKIKIIRNKTIINSLEDIPEWNYDGNSTGEASLETSEVKLIPIKFYHHVNNNLFPYLVLCETHNVSTNKRCQYSKSREIFDKYKDLEPMFGLKQEFFMLNENGTICKPNKDHDGKYYCGNGLGSYKTREYLIDVMYLCEFIGVKLTGLNYESAPGQAKFQVCNIGIDACYDLLILRYLLIRIGEKYNICPSFDPKPFNNENGSGCHINFSTKNMRDENNKKELTRIVYKMCKNLEANHDNFINNYYGAGNKARLSGTCKTSSYKTFTVKKASRGVSVRIPSIGNYFEDRRSSSNINPYLACSKLLECVLIP
jgi:glutamine synthetase